MQGSLNHAPLFSLSAHLEITSLESCAFCLQTKGEPEGKPGEPAPDPYSATNWRVTPPYRPLEEGEDGALMYFSLVSESCGNWVKPS
jgi:hypothetical protein